MMQTRTVLALALALFLVPQAIATDEPAKTSLSPPVLLPDGTEFKTWECPPSFSRTLYVDQAHPRASDENPGTEEQPLRSINRAAQMAMPGGRVVVAAGVYRERVSPARGGTGPGRMISYEAAPGAEVILKGSRVLKAEWVAAEGPVNAKPRLWTVRLPAELFDGYDPFAQLNLTDARIDECMPWATSTKGKVPNTLRRGLVFQDGRRLVQVAARGDVAKEPGRYFVEADGLTLIVRPFDDANPPARQWEVTTQETIFAPEDFGLGYIRIKGFTVEHCANGFPRPQLGAISTMRGHHWIIEGNTVRQVNAIGIDIGDQFDTRGPDLAQGGQHVVRRNTITDCGIGGLEGKQIAHTLIEENIIRRCGWHDIWRIYEVGGIKVHCTRSCLLRRNLVTDTVSAPGIWMDYANVNSRCTGNVVIGADCSNGGIFMEASQEPNLVDTNIVWATRGNGIYQHDCDELTIAHNLVGRSTDAAVRMRTCKERDVLGRLSTAKRNKIIGNIFVDNAKPPAISDPDNTCDYNVYAAGDGSFDLAKWQQAHGWDRHSIVLPIKAELDPAKLTLQWTISGRLPTCPTIPPVTHDFCGQPRDAEGTIAGPILSLRHSVQLGVNPIQ